MTISSCARGIGIRNATSRLVGAPSIFGLNDKDDHIAPFEGVSACVGDSASRPRNKMLHTQRKSKLVRAWLILATAMPSVLLQKQARLAEEKQNLLIPSMCNVGDTGRAWSCSSAEACTPPPASKTAPVFRQAHKAAFAALQLVTGAGKHSWSRSRARPPCKSDVCVGRRARRCRGASCSSSAHVRSTLAAGMPAKACQQRGCVSPECDTKGLPCTRELVESALGCDPARNSRREGAVKLAAAHRNQRPGAAHQLRAKRGLARGTRTLYFRLICVPSGPGCAFLRALFRVEGNAQRDRPVGASLWPHAV